MDETRKLKFRDSAMIADAKSRFSSIVDEINLDENEFINAITAAINAESSGSASASTKSTPVKTTAPVSEPDVDDEPVMVDEPEVDDITLDVDEPTVDLDALCDNIRDAFKAADAATKKNVKVVLTANGATKLDAALGIDVLQEIADVLGI